MKYIKLYEDINWNDWDNEEENDELIFDLDNKLYPPFKNIKINDRIEFIVNNKSYFATVIGIPIVKNILNICLTFEFDDFINGHDGYFNQNIGKNGHCWNIIEHDNPNIFRRDIDELIKKLKQIK
jgi:hypothetical protein